MEKNNLNFYDNLNYALLNLEKAKKEVNALEDKIYFELSKSQIIEYINFVYESLKCWQENYNSKKYDLIMKNYKEIESIVSQLEICLAEHDNKFHMDGISYSVFQIGKNLNSIRKESDNNGRR